MGFQDKDRVESGLTDRVGTVIAGLAEHGEYWRDVHARPGGIDRILAFERDQRRVRYVGWE